MRVHIDWFQASQAAEEWRTAEDDREKDEENRKKAEEEMMNEQEGRVRPVNDPVRVWKNACENVLGVVSPPGYAPQTSTPALDL